MGESLSLHPIDPQPRILARATDVLQRGGVVIAASECTYLLLVAIGDKEALERVRGIRQLNPRHLFTLICRDLSEVAQYAMVDNSQYRLLRAATPGPYTFVLKASRNVPRRLQQPKRRTIGLRIPASPVLQALLDSHGEPLLGTTLIVPGCDDAESDPGEIARLFQSQTDLILDSGPGGLLPTTVIDLTAGAPLVTRLGAGETSHLFESD
ncbi:MAG: threonylcarbamoyl-AMP synthase [Gammaproteobacteria bacterium]|nr:threonylcarbamoyl-AMP synthase [Gammaproteobacteria bacterium]